MNVKASNDTSDPTPKGAKAEKRRRILDAAIRVFAQKGFYATRVSEIAKEAQVADGTIYLYFENKDALLTSIFDDRIRALLRVLREELAEERPFPETFRRFVALQLGLLEGQRDLAEVVTVNLRQSSILLKEYAAPLFAEYLNLLASLIKSGQEQGLVRQQVRPHTTARALWGALDGLTLTWALGGGETSALRKSAQQCSELFLNGISSREG